MLLLDVKAPCILLFHKRESGWGSDPRELYVGAGRQSPRLSGSNGLLVIVFQPLERRLSRDPRVVGHERKWVLTLDGICDNAADVGRNKIYANWYIK